MLLSYVCESARASDGGRPGDHAGTKRRPRALAGAAATPSLARKARPHRRAPAHRREVPAGSPRPESPPPSRSPRSRTVRVGNPGLRGAASSPRRSGPCVLPASPGLRAEPGSPSERGLPPALGAEHGGATAAPGAKSWSLQGG